MTHEDRRSIPTVPWFLFNRRRTFRRDLERGEVEVLTFTVERAWAFMTCDGPPCCPMSWFIDAGGGDFVNIRSWEWLRFAPDHHFPGRQVMVERLPESNWLITAAASDAPVPVLPFQETLAAQTDVVCGAEIVYSASDQL